MRIGELSQRSGISVRSLRYYEQQGLLTADRRGNGYRDYTEQAVATVAAIRSLLAMGLPTALIAEVLPCTEDTRAVDACSGLLERVSALRDDVRVRAAQLDSIEVALTSFLDGEQQRLS